MCSADWFRKKVPWKLGLTCGCLRPGSCGEWPRSCGEPGCVLPVRRPPPRPQLGAYDVREVGGVRCPGPLRCWAAIWAGSWMGTKFPKWSSVNKGEALRLGGAVSQFMSCPRPSASPKKSIGAASGCDNPGFGDLDEKNMVPSVNVSSSERESTRELCDANKVYWLIVLTLE